MITKTTIKRKAGVSPHKPILIVGLPGIGNVGKIVAEHLKKEFKAEKFATLYSPHFPHQVVMLKNGGVRVVNNRFYLIKGKKPNNNDLIILTGDVQAVTPEGQYEVNSKIVDFFKEDLAGEFVYTIGGYTIGEGGENKSRVFANATGASVIKQFKDTDVIFGKSKGMIWGSAGLIIGFAKMRKLDGVCLMGETNSFLEVDASAAKAVMLQLAKKLHLNIDTANIDKMIEKTAIALKEIEKQMGMANQPQQAYPVLPFDDKDHKPSYIR
jgi:uncharacterized protein